MVWTFITTLLEVATFHRNEASTHDRILALVNERPGLPIGMIISELQLGSGTIHYHLRRLEETSRIHTVVTGRRRLVFPGPSRPWLRERAMGLSILRGRTANAVAVAIVREPNRSVMEIIEDLAESPRATYYHLKRLRDAGLIVSGTRTRYQRIAPAPQLAELLRELADEPLAEDAPPQAPSAPSA